MASKQIPQLLIPEHNQPTVEVCDICGDTGVTDLILTCPRCKTSREHCYCRKIFSRNYHDDWACDDCMGERRGSYNVNQDTENPVISKLPSFIGRHRAVEKIVTKGKVRCIPPEEVIKLASGSKSGEGPVRIIKTKVHQKDISLKSSSISEALPGNKETSSAIQGQGRRISHAPKEMITVQAIRKELIGSIEPAATTAPAKIKEASLVRETSSHREALSSAVPKNLSAGVNSERRTVQAISKELIESIEPEPEPAATTAPAKTKDASLVRERSTHRDALSSPAPKKLCTGVCSVDDKPAVDTKLASSGEKLSAPNKASSAQPLENQLPQPISSGHQVSGDLDARVSGLEKHGQKNNDPKPLKSSRIPARDSSWKGRFEILVDTFHDVYFLFEAHACSRGSRKVLDYSKRMPQLLQFTLIQQEEAWKNLFQNQCPNEDDIGLYFFSCEEKRSSGCDLIHTIIDSQKFALRCVLGGVELYIFTSKTLPANYQKLDYEYFLWGVFHKIGKKKDVAELYKEPPSAVHESSNSPQNKETNNDNNDYVVDMEIDMMGGQDLEIMQVTPRDSSPGGTSNVGHDILSPKKEPFLACPPGFEEVYRLKIKEI